MTIRAAPMPDRRLCGSDQGHDPHQPRPGGLRQYSWAARRNYYIGTTGIDTFVTMQFTSDFQEKDIVFAATRSSPRS